MDDELTNLEDELRELRPRPPSPLLVSRVGRALAVEQPRSVLPSKSHGWLWAAAVPVAAALAVMAGFAMNRPPLPRPAAARNANAETEGALKPVAAQNVLYAARDEGLVTLGDGTPARRARLNYVDTFVWENPRTKASLKWSIPREEVRVVPIAFQ